MLAIRASTSLFHGRDGAVLGALAVLTDITALKRLELQIRRSDRLASLGTLSAGMAHEIKNPLVSIKTFAQLLPERYAESDFRETFSSLIVHEINRIDSLVNQLRCRLALGRTRLFHVLLLTLPDHDFFNGTTIRLDGALRL